MKERSDYYLSLNSVDCLFSSGYPNLAVVFVCVCLFWVCSKCDVSYLIVWRCRVRMTGDLVLSFPAGIIRVLRENPYPTSLRFCIKNISNLEQILVNKQLISELVQTCCVSFASTCYAAYKCQHVYGHLVAVGIGTLCHDVDWRCLDKMSRT